LGLVAVVCALWGAVSAASGDVVIETMPVGNAGNSADPGTGFGAVKYNYNIGKFEVTAGQYTAFLNAVAGVDTYNLYNTAMWSGSTGCKIERYAGDGIAGSVYQYRVAADYADRPVNYVSFWDACRFANWLNNGRGGAGTTEYGAYSLTADAITSNTVTRNAGATWAVTSEDEWYKAAYFDAASSSYYLYPTSSNTAPSNVGGDDYTDPGNHANFHPDSYTIGSPYYRSKVGEFENSASPYGTFDQGGNVWEWNEAIVTDSTRGLRGGSFASTVDVVMQSDRRYSFLQTEELEDVGFRVVQLVPEPASLGIMGMGVVGMLVRRRGGRR
jgi:formylglycine-generating enzyme required for sulfatase activity